MAIWPTCFWAHVFPHVLSLARISMTHRRFASADTRRSPCIYPMPPGCSSQGEPPALVESDATHCLWVKTIDGGRKDFTSAYNYFKTSVEVRILHACPMDRGSGTLSWCASEASQKAESRRALHHRRTTEANGTGSTSRGGFG